MKRVLALFAAGLLIVGAVLFRSVIDDDGNTRADDSPRDVSSGGDEPVVLTCDETLAAVCDQLDDEFEDLEIRIEPGSTTTASLASADDGGDAGTDGWLTLQPLPGMVTDARDRAGHRPLLTDDTATLARSPLVTVVWDDRASVLTDSCDVVDWRCIGDRAGDPWPDIGGDAGWGVLAPGFADPASDTVGLLVLGEAATQFFGSADFASNDFDQDGFRGWVTELRDAVPSFAATVDTPLQQMLVAGPAAYDLVGTTEAEALLASARSRDSDRLVVIYPPAPSVADVVLVPITGSAGAERLAEIGESSQLAEALAAEGWRVEGTAPPFELGADAPQTLPDQNNLPRPGVLQALRDV